MRKDLICKKGKIKRNNVIEKNKNVSLWLYYKKEHERTKSKLAGNS